MGCGTTTPPSRLQQDRACNRTARRPHIARRAIRLCWRLPIDYLVRTPEWAWFWGIASTGIILLTTYRLADRLYGKTIARIATLIIAFYPALILYTGQPMSDLVFTAGLMLVWYVVTLHPPYRWLETIGIGVALGLLTLTRSVSIGLFLVVPLLWFIKQANVRKLLLHFILLTCVFAACLIPWMLRNYTIFGTPTLTTNMGLHLYIGNHTDASGTCDLTRRACAIYGVQPRAQRSANRSHFFASGNPIHRCASYRCAIDPAKKNHPPFLA